MITLVKNPLQSFNYFIREIQNLNESNNGYAITFSACIFSHLLNDAKSVYSLSPSVLIE